MDRLSWLNPEFVPNADGCTQLTVGASGILANDLDPDGGQLAVTAIDDGNLGNPIAGSYGILVLNSDGSYELPLDGQPEHVSCSRDCYGQLHNPRGRHGWRQRYGSPVSIK